MVMAISKMNKRVFLRSSVFSALAFFLAAPRGVEAAGQQWRTIRPDGVSFSWRHEDERLFARLEAPTQGWIAAGFNDEPSLKNTRFVIAAPSQAPLRAEDHIALVPDHRNVVDLGLSPAVSDIAGTTTSKGSALEFSLPHRFGERPTLTLGPGSRTYLMLAFSHEADFAHHSAWRRHFTITL